MTKKLNLTVLRCEEKVWTSAINTLFLDERHLLTAQWIGGTVRAC